MDHGYLDEEAQALVSPPRAESAQSKRWLLRGLSLALALGFVAVATWTGQGGG